MGGERGEDGNKKVIGRKRPIIVDPLGLRLAVWVTAAAAAEGPAAPQVLATLDAPTPPRLARLWAEHKDDHRPLTAGSPRRKLGTGSRWGSARSGRRDGCCCIGAGGWSGPSLGSGDIGGPARTMRD